MQVISPLFCAYAQVSAGQGSVTFHRWGRSPHHPLGHPLAQLRAVLTGGKPVLQGTADSNSEDYCFPMYGFGKKKKKVSKIRSLNIIFAPNSLLLALKGMFVRTRLLQ